MNYRHAFHAGNFADVFKHAILALILEHLRAKPAPFCVVDTHAGIGRYDLESEPARRTGEAVQGVLRVLEQAVDAPPPLRPYLAALAAAGELPRWYPGSPCLTRALMRPGDRLVLAELHPEDAETLRRQFTRDRAVTVHRRDGWELLKAALPPAEKRGLVLVDPPYEDRAELERLAGALAAAYRRWPTGIFALWFPIKERAAVWRLHELLIATQVPRLLAAELMLNQGDDPWQLNGCGMILANPPWKLDQALSELLPWLHRALAAPGGDGRVEWLVSENPSASSQGLQGAAG